MPNVETEPHHQLLCDECSRPANMVGKGFKYCDRHYQEHERAGTLPPPICDFCGTTKLKDARTYEVESFAFLTPPKSSIDIGSAGNWLVCSACHALIQRDDWLTLSYRVQQTIPHQLISLPDDELSAMCNSFVDKFRENMSRRNWRAGTEPNEAARLGMPQHSGISLSLKQANKLLKQKLTLKNYFELLPELLRIEGDLAEVWYFRTGMPEQMMLWAKTWPDSYTSWIRREQTALPIGYKICFAWESARNVLILIGKENIEEEITWKAFTVYKTGNLGRWGPKPWNKKYHDSIARIGTEAIMMRMFALNTEALLKQRVEIGVAQSTKPRRKLEESIPLITVVRWRKTHTQGSEEKLDEHGRIVEWSHRWLVSPHLRHLKDGRIIPIPEYIKGPGHLPLVVKKKVNVVDR